VVSKPQTQYWTKHQRVPLGFGAVLAAMRATGNPQLDAYLVAAVSRGWTLVALGDALGITREGVRLRCLRFPGFVGEVPDVPEPPRRPIAHRPPRKRLLIKPEMAEKLREMQAVAATVNGGMATDHPARRVSEEFAATCADLVAQGVSVYTIAKAIGVTHNAIFFRLARHGYRQPAPSQSRFPYRNRKIGDPASTEVAA
jgi:transposase-like protein